MKTAMLFPTVLAFMLGLAAKFMNPLSATAVALIGSLVMDHKKHGSNHFYFLLGWLIAYTMVFNLV